MKNILLFLLLVSCNYSIAQNITATIPYQGYDETEAFLGQGEFEIFLDATTGVLDKPVIFLDGFDPGDNNSIAELYNALDFGSDNLADILRNEEFDVVLLNFPTYMSNGVEIDGGADYIQRNAMVLVELINQINSQKVGDEELVIVGPSMGGLISRYALAYMEQQSIAHETRLFISFDAPHLGANIPISFQYFINDLGEELDNVQAQEIVQRVLNSAASKEILVDHYLGHLLDGSTFMQDPTKLLPAGAPDFRDAFQAELDALGFPQQVRNVSMVNGSDIGTMTGTPGMQIISTTLNILPTVDSNVVLNFTPAAGETIEVTSFVNTVGPVTISSFMANASSPSFSDGVDSAPGGKNAISTSLGPTGINPAIDAFVNAIEQDTFCFIPTISALAIENEDDWHASIDIDGSQTTPFVNTFSPTVNEDHLQLTPSNAAFALAEIREEPLSVAQELFENAIVLTKNPVGNKITIKVNTGIIDDDIELLAYNTVGQQVMTKHFNSGTAIIETEHRLSSGVYILHLKTKTNTAVLRLVVE